MQLGSLSSFYVHEEFHDYGPWCVSNILFEVVLLIFVLMFYNFWTSSFSSTEVELLLASLSYAVLLAWSEPVLEQRTFTLFLVLCGTGVCRACS